MANAWIAWILLAYLAGSIPTAVWLSTYVFGKDVRKGGSGNAGATNMMRQFGKKAGLLVFVIDVAKGMMAVYLPHWFGARWPEHWPAMEPNWLLGLSAALGHVYPVWASFRGGKAVATLLGALLAIDLASAGIALLVFALVLGLGRMVSLASLAAAWAFAVYSWWAFPDATLWDQMAIHGLPILLTWTHRSNLKRLVLGQETRLDLWKRK